MEGRQGRPERLQYHRIAESPASMRVRSVTGSDSQTQGGIDGRIWGGSVGATELKGVPIVR